MIDDKEKQRRRLFGERLKKLRKSKGFAQAYVAKELDKTLDRDDFWNLPKSLMNENVNFAPI